MAECGPRVKRGGAGSVLDLEEGSQRAAHDLGLRDVLATGVLLQRFVLVGVDVADEPQQSAAGRRLLRWALWHGPARLPKVRSACGHALYAVTCATFWPMSGRDPCPGCGRLIAKQGRDSDAPRFEHRCPHGHRCIAWRRYWERGGWEHWRACPECCAAARVAGGTTPTPLDCRHCSTPLPFDPEPFVRSCPPPPHGAVLVMGVRCSKCGAAYAFRIVGERVTRLGGSRTKGTAAAERP